MSRTYNAMKALYSVLRSTKRATVKYAVQTHAMLRHISLYRWLDDFGYTMRRYNRVFGRYPNLVLPKTYNEYLTRKKLFDRNPLLTRLADKYEVRQYVREKVGEQYLPELYLVTDVADDIDISSLPDSFVIKATHGCAMNIIVPDSRQVDQQQIVDECAGWLRTNYYLVGREWCYRDIQPRLIVEQFLGGSRGVVPTDYKFLCFDGKARFVFVILDRFGVMKSEVYDTSWVRLNVTAGNYVIGDEPLPTPPELGHMILLAERLAEGLDSVRVDLYDVDGQVYFGEMTNYMGCGFMNFHPESFDAHMGTFWPTKRKATRSRQ